MREVIKKLQIIQAHYSVTEYYVEMLILHYSK